MIPRSVYTCSLSELLQPCVSNSLPAKYERIPKASVWRRIADSPADGCTCESFHGQLLAVGGRDDDMFVSFTEVYMYDSATDSWKFISNMTIGRHSCFTAVLPDNQLMVVGGFDDDDELTDTVEFASVCD